ncbi:MAG: hypothetical protein WCE94_07730 [Candidatus Methanoperedens sp.]
MESKYKTLIPLIIIFFIIGVAVGYVAHKPVTVTIEKIVTVTVTPIPTPTPITTPITTTISTPVPTPTATAAATVTPVISDFIVRNYDPSTDKPVKIIELTKNGANPNIVSVHPGDALLIRITGYSSQSPLTLILNSTYSQNLGTSGAVIVTFNKRGSYSFNAVVTSSDPNIIPRPYAEGTISVY